MYKVSMQCINTIKFTFNRKQIHLYDFSMNYNKTNTFVQ